MIFSNKLDLFWTRTLFLYMLTLLKHARSTRLKFSKFAKMAATISRLRKSSEYEESVVDKFKSNLLLMIFCLHIINYNS